MLQRDPEWAGAHQGLVTLLTRHARVPAGPGGPDPTAIPAAEPLTDRELQVLRQVSCMLTTAEIASELYISTNTVKSHIKRSLECLRNEVAIRWNQTNPRELV